MIFYHSAVILALCGLIILLLWNLRWFWTVPVERTPPPAKGAPFVSVLVPARNEALRITPCAKALAAQDYPNYEVVILDDHSEDGTGDLLRSLGYSDEAGARLRVVRGQPLPEGWTGKSWACHQLAQIAKADLGDYLLFLDADTDHTPQMISSAISLAQEARADLLSAWPKLETESWGEKLILPMIHLALVFYPYGFFQWLQLEPSRFSMIPRRLRRMFGAANGQFLLFRREAYARIGGHEAQKSHMVEDVALGRAVAAQAGEGLRLINCDGSSISSVRMYTNLDEVWEGLTKNIRAAFEGNLIGYLLTGTVVSLLFLLPFFWIWISFGEEFWLVALQILLIYLIRFLMTIRFRSTWFGAIFHPFGLLLTIAIALNSWRRSAGDGVTWKGRLYKVVHEASHDGAIVKK